jgi:hypothetical protein
MRLLFALLATTAGLGLVAAGLALLRSSPPEQLLPDLDQATPSGLSVVKAGRSQSLTFLSAVENDGPGPLLVEGRRASAAERSMTVRQIIRTTDGEAKSLPTRSTLRYVKAETHAHWHILAFERYELRTADGSELVSPDEKTGFCLGDRFDANVKIRVENEPDQAVWTEECGRGKPGLLHVAEGISPGYGDDYVPKLEGQYVRLTGVPAGRYLLVHRVNADLTLQEGDYANNAASVLLELRRPKRGPPAVEILARCPDTDHCE